MPVSPQIGASYAQDVAVLYQQAELRILQRISDTLASGVELPDWQARMLAQQQQVRDYVIATLNEVNPQAASQILADLQDAYSVGGLAAVRDLRGLVPSVQVPAATLERRVRALVADVQQGLTTLQPAILRRVDDVYRDVVAQAASAVVSGGLTRATAVQEALHQFAGQGIDRIPVGRGTMNLPDYTTMAVRTATARAAVQGSTDTMVASGVSLVVVHPGPRACDICDGWARQILTLAGGPEGDIVVQRVDGPGTVVVHVTGSLDDARAGGWGHPNCRCSVAAYLPGATDPSIIQRPTWDRAGYEAQQRQRILERQIRQAKIGAATAVTPEGRQAAQAAVRARQQALRQHLDDHTYLKRQTAREQVISGRSGGEQFARSIKPRTPAPEAAFVDRLHGLLTSGKLTVADLQAQAAGASALGQANAAAAIARHQADLADAAARRTAAAAIRGGGDGFPPLSADLQDMLRPKDGTFRRSRRAALEATLKESAEGRRFLKAFDTFQSGSNIPRLRTDIAKRLTGEELTPARQGTIDTILGAIRSSDATDRALYRGMAIPGGVDAVLGRYTAGSSLDITLGSFSSDRGIAGSFTDPRKGAGQKVRSSNTTPVMVELRKGDPKSALPVQNLSPNDALFHEKEWLVSGRYRVVSAAPGKVAGQDGVRVVIEEVEGWNGRA